MADDLRTTIRRFVEDYRRVRLEEGFASTDPDFCRRLPFVDTTGRNRGIWRLRALHYLVVRAGIAALPRVERILDVGAGNGWLARRLARSYRVTALDVDAAATGLGGLKDPRVGALCGDFEALPLRSGSFDVAVAAAVLHYALDLGRALAELARVLRPGGVLVVADSPFYESAGALEQAWQRTQVHYQRAGAGHLAGRYRGLTRDALDGAGLFRFVTLSPGPGTLRSAFARLRGREGGARMPVLFGWKR
jgi:SAM-dependent methyltransferase